MLKYACFEIVSTGEVAVLETFGRFTGVKEDGKSQSGIIADAVSYDYLTHHLKFGLLLLFNQGFNVFGLAWGKG